MTEVDLQIRKSGYKEPNPENSVEDKKRDRNRSGAGQVVQTRVLLEKACPAKMDVTVWI